MTFEEISQFNSGIIENKNRRKHSVFFKEINGKTEFTGNITYIDKNVTLPQYLIRYFSPEKHNFNALKENYLWASNPLEFNDILDCSILHWNHKSFTKKNLIDIEGKDIFQIVKGKDTLENRLNFVGLRLQTMGIICLNSGENQDLLWGYYNENKGFSIEYNTSKLIDSLGITPLKIDYVDNLEKLDYGIDYHPKMLRWGTIKKSNWEIEDEWRFVYFDTHQNRIKKYDNSAINKIVLGFYFFERENLEKLDIGQFLYQAPKNSEKKKFIEYLSSNHSSSSLCWVNVNEFTLELEKVPITITQIKKSKFQISVDFNSLEILK
jgi:hypothetical protein